MKVSDIDKFGEAATRRLADFVSRRSLLSRLGMAVVAAPVFPLLPVQRAEAQETPVTRRPGPAASSPEAAKLTDFYKKAQSNDPGQCNYWRYCAIDGNLCASCGGGVHTCPPGASPSPTSWVGTCINPDDGRAYVIAYRDCCGKSGCASGPFCDNTDRATPIYRPQGNNDIIWCFGAEGMAYTCSTAVLVGAL